MKITLEWLKENEACEKSMLAWQYYGLESLDVFECFDTLKARQKNIQQKYDENSLKWVLWLILHCMENEKNIARHTNFASKLALPVFEKKYPGDSRMRKSIDVVDKWLENSESVTIRELIVAGDFTASAVDADYTAEELHHAEGDAALLKIIDYGIKLLKEEIEASDNNCIS